MKEILILEKLIFSLESRISVRIFPIMVSNTTPDPDNQHKGKLSLKLDAALITEARSNLRGDKTLDSLIESLLREKIAESKNPSR